MNLGLDLFRTFSYYFLKIFELSGTLEYILSNFTTGFIVHTICVPCVGAAQRLASVVKRKRKQNVARPVVACLWATPGGRRR